MCDHKRFIRDEAFKLSQDKEDVEISWDSSGSENPLEELQNIINKKKSSKQKYKKTKDVIKHFENLDVSITKDCNMQTKSPILKPTATKLSQSPILKPTQIKSNRKNKRCYENVSEALKLEKSPILEGNNEKSINLSQKVRKRLKLDVKSSSQDLYDSSKKSPILSDKSINWENEEANKINRFFQLNLKSENHSPDIIINDTPSASENSQSKSIDFSSQECSIFKNSNENQTSQPQKSVDMFVSQSEFKFSKIEHDDDSPRRKIRYKKGGLAHRLQNLLKQEKSLVSLWQHEKFLAANSDFILPNDSSYRIYKIQCCFTRFNKTILEIIDTETNEVLYVILNKIISENINIKVDNLLRLYLPYDFRETKGFKYIVNVFRLEVIES